MRERLDKRAEEASSKFVGLQSNFQAKRPYPDRTLESQVILAPKEQHSNGMESLRSVTGENND
jgi:hypothetical protein